MKLAYRPNALLSVFGERITYKGQVIKAIVEIGEYDGKGSGFVDKALADKAQIWVRAKDVPEPRSKDEVYINGANGTLTMYQTLTARCIVWKLSIT